MVGMPIPQWVERLAQRQFGERARVVRWRQGLYCEVYRIIADDGDYAFRMALTNTPLPGYDGCRFNVAS